MSRTSCGAPASGTPRRSSKSTPRSVSPARWNAFLHSNRSNESVEDSAADAHLASLLGEPTSLNLTRGEDAKFYWFNRLLHTRRPLQEKMTLFWHTHFATALSKVNDGTLLLNQVDLFRSHALGNFETLMQNVTRDPAMLIWLDNRQNRRRAPNENYAREVMELFTVGIGQYDEEDVKEAARAFTGYTIDRQRNFVFLPGQHDDGLKTFMGVTMNWDADDILATLVRHPATAQRIPAKLFAYFVYPNPPSSTLDRLAQTFTSSNFDTRAVMRDILTGPEFVSGEAYRALVKSPTEFVVGSLKALNVKGLGPNVTAFLRQMGQDLLNPPDVNGWAGGAEWINSTTLFNRFNFANLLASGRNPARPYFVDVERHLLSYGLSTLDAIVDHYLALLVDADATPESRRALLDYMGPADSFALTDRSIDKQVRGMLHLVMSLPTYQLA